MVVDTRTGEILALANFVTYNPNNRERLTGAQLRKPGADRHLRTGVGDEASAPRR